MKLQPLDMIVSREISHCELVTSARMKAEGYRFIVADIDIATFQSRRIWIESPSRFLVACHTENGTNFYAKA